MQTKPSVLVTQRWPTAVEQRLERDYRVTLNPDTHPMSPVALQQALKTHDAVLPTVTDSLSADVLDLPSVQCRILANFGVGYSHIDDSAARRLGLTVTNTPDVLSECTADIAMTLMLMVARRAGEGERLVRASNWQGWHPTQMLGSKVSGKTLGIVGYGRIGQAMAKRAHHGFGMAIKVYNRSQVNPKVLADNNATQIDALDDLLACSDYVSLHCPGGEANRHLINTNRLQAMQPTAFLINTARGEVVDESALAHALESGTIAGAGLDVYDGEPHIDSALLRSPNTVLLPHLGSATRETREAMGFRVLDNLDAFFAGGEPPDKVI